MTCAKRETAVYDPQAYPHDKGARRSRLLKNILVVIRRHFKGVGRQLKTYLLTLTVYHVTSKVLVTVKVYVIILNVYLVTLKVDVIILNVYLVTLKVYVIILNVYLVT